MGPATTCDSRRSEAPCAKSISQNRAVVQPLTSMPFGFVRRPCHTPYICRRVNDFESQRGPFHAQFLPFRPFHHGVFEAFRNILFASRLALTSTEHEARIRPKKGVRPHVPKTKDDRNGTVHQRHQDHERPVRASSAPHLLRRAITCEGAAENGRKGHRSAAQAGIFDSSG